MWLLGLIYNQDIAEPQLYTLALKCSPIILRLDIINVFVYFFPAYSHLNWSICVFKEQNLDYATGF